MADIGFGRPRVYLHNLGCPKNEADTRAVRRELIRAGIEVVEVADRATHILLNTCGFIQEAKEESIEAILAATASYPDKQMLVMGCLVERYRKELAAGIPEVDGWFGLAGGADQEALVRSLRGEGAGAALAADERRSAAPVRGNAVGTDARSSYAYIKISDGCDELCTFCAIPGIKGAYHAATPGQILADVGECLSEGARELVLVGQDTARWESGGIDLVGLVDLLAADPRITWLRVMYLQPDHVDDALLELVARQTKLCHYLDIPLQHSHPQVLRRMGRIGDPESYLDLLAKARRLIPDVSLRSTFIVGFPGETDAQFEHLLDFVRQAEFDYAGGFIYSPEEGTPACRLKPRVPARVARERLYRLNEVLGYVAESSHQRQVGATVDVILDAIGGDDDCEGAEVVGRTRGQAPEVDGVVHVEGLLPEWTRVGDVIRVTIEAAVGYDFIGSSVES
jgi:ribosomal protein S12 methylthiotransferase